MTEPTPENPTPTDPVVDDPPDTSTPPVESDQPCVSVYPRDQSIVCELFLNHFDFRLPHTRHANDTIYEWE